MGRKSLNASLLRSPLCGANKVGKHWQTDWISNITFRASYGVKSITFCNSWQDEVGVTRNILNGSHSQNNCCFWQCLVCGSSWSTLFFLVPFSRSKEGHQHGGKDGEGRVEDDKSDQGRNGLEGKPLEWNLSCFLADLVRAESKTDYQRVNTNCQIPICSWSILHFLFRVHLLLKWAHFHGLCWSSNVDELVERGTLGEACQQGRQGLLCSIRQVKAIVLRFVQWCPMQALTWSLFQISIREQEFYHFSLIHRCRNENFFLLVSCFEWESFFLSFSCFKART